VGNAAANAGIRTSTLWTYFDCFCQQVNTACWFGTLPRYSSWCVRPSSYATTTSHCPIRTGKM